MNKMKEMGLSNSEGYYDLEYRHGPMSLVDENTLIVCLSNKACRDGDKALMEQMKSYGATVAVLGGELGDTFDQIADLYTLWIKAGMICSTVRSSDLSDSCWDIILQRAKIWMQIPRDI